MTKPHEIEEIAHRYHQSGEVADKFIENALQYYSYQLISQHLRPAPQSVLELGYGEGIITEALISSGHRVALVEGSRSLADAAREKWGSSLSVHHCLFEDVILEAKFDWVLACHVLEHVEQPVELIRRTRDWLNAGGKLLIIVPNAESLHRRLAVRMGLHDKLDHLGPRDLLVGHLRVYSFDTLKTDVENGGFRIVASAGYFLKTVPNSLMLNYDPKLLDALLTISPSLPKEMLANLLVVAEPVVRSKE
jgi:SAM-dependent methyltransferase